MGTNDKRLIEATFPLKQTSLDSVHEKSVRHGHISTLHIWPARRPLAASRAALIATLLTDPGNKEDRDQILERLAGKIVKVPKKKKMPSGKMEEKLVEETVGGVLHWGRESGPDFDWFRKRILEEYGGRAPRVLDPFAGGGAIPLEAMRLGCEVTAVDVNAVAWFILRCTLEYPHDLADQHRPLPDFALGSPQFMEQFFKGTGKLTPKQLERNLAAVQQRLFPPQAADLAWHVRAWGHWVLDRVRRELGEVYPKVAGKRTVAYLWARTVKCKNCRAIIPLLKTRWLCKTDKKRVLLVLAPTADRTAVMFAVENNVPKVGGNTAQRREHDKRIGLGTMSRSGASCPCCESTIMTMEEIRAEGMAGRLGSTMISTVVDGGKTKEYLSPSASGADGIDLEKSVSFGDTPNIVVDEPLSPASTRSISCHLYGVKTYRDLFTQRQLLALSRFAAAIHEAAQEMVRHEYPQKWAEAIGSYLCLSFDRLLSFTCVNVRWKVDAEAVVDAFARFSISLLWDFAEPNPIGEAAGSWLLCYQRIATALDGLGSLGANLKRPSIFNASATDIAFPSKFDIILTDPPYYQAISYADLSDFFYVWLRGLLPVMPDEFQRTTTAKGTEIVQHIRADKNRADEKSKYESGMAAAFSNAKDALTDDGRFVCVFAHKDPEAWETLTSAMIRAGFVVTASWPIQTEMLSRQRASATAALASSVWLVCKKRLETARPGWDNNVLEEMTGRIQTQMRDFWDAGIRGPDFVWAATGPALEVYSRHPVVKKANAAGELMTVPEFLRHVRRIVVDFIVGQVLSQSGAGELITGLDDVTTYYILHRYDFGFDDAPVGGCILYAISCGLTDRELTDRYELLLRTGGSDGDEEEDETGSEEAGDAEATSGSKVKLKPWNNRKGFAGETEGKLVPLIDQVHRLMHLWKAQDVVKVDEYLDSRALRRSRIFAQLLQALIELSPIGSEERSILESLSNHVAALGVAFEDKQMPLGTSRPPEASREAE